MSFPQLSLPLPGSPFHVTNNGRTVFYNSERSRCFQDPYVLIPSSQTTLFIQFQLNCAKDSNSMQPKYRGTLHSYAKNNCLGNDHDRTTAFSSLHPLVTAPHLDLNLIWTYGQSSDQCLERTHGGSNAPHSLTALCISSWKFNISKICHMTRRLNQTKEIKIDLLWHLRSRTTSKNGLYIDTT